MTHFTFLNWYSNDIVLTGAYSIDARVNFDWSSSFWINRILFSIDITMFFIQQCSALFPRAIESFLYLSIDGTIYRAFVDFELFKFAYFFSIWYYFIYTKNTYTKSRKITSLKWLSNATFMGLSYPTHNKQHILMNTSCWPRCCLTTYHHVTPTHVHNNRLRKSKHVI